MASAFLKLEKLSRRGRTFRFGQWNQHCSKLSYRAASESGKMEEEEEAPSSGISRPLSEILKELNKKVPDSLVKTRHEKDGFPIRYIPWHTVNRILNLHVPEWSGEVRNITYSADSKSVSVVYRVTLYGTDAEVPTYHFTLHKEIHYSVLCISFTDTSMTKSNQTNPLWCFGQCRRRNMKGE
ncbi:hypothetical protein VIGAN_06268900 [Vigna angularis var. angularis]|uniref:Uncharacterized protein n=1 Tax=Vigna angularis var. angularis TaxID=157739 RepID=A0A0S3SEW6_PHAAN|nr:hypothetical protein VIGAN_06268900 [Vigna angularis var. angularis]